MRRFDPWEYRIVVWLLSPLAFLYRWIQTFRNWLYDKEIWRSVRVSVPVISVGNITVGGTGKTPLVEVLARFFAQEGWKVGILTRGYGRRSRGMVVVSDGKTVIAKPRITGDEPLILAYHLLPHRIPVLVGRDRVATAKKAIEIYNCNLLILDDGFQYRRLQRNVDIVSLRMASPFGNRKLLPAGPLREPLDSLERGHVLVLTGLEKTNPIDFAGAGHFLAKMDVLKGYYKPIEWVLFSDKSTYPLELFSNRSVFAFAGIGNPHSFQKVLSQLELKLMDFWIYPDHHFYSKRELQKIAKYAEQKSAVAVVTTEKDAVRFTSPWLGELPLYYLKIQLEIVGEEERLRRVLLPLLKTLKPSSTKQNDTQM